MDIDNLVGDDLNRAVLLALGAELICGSRSVFWTLNDRRIPDKRYAWHVDDAWELDGEGWRWSFVEHDDGKRLQVFLHHPVIDMVYTVVTKSDFPTKAAAYATARCRAWLKAKTAEREARE